MTKNELDWGSVAGETNGELEEIFPDVYRLRGTVRFKGGALFPRNMVIVRNGESLTVVHGVRLPDADQARVVDSLGRVEHLVRLGAFHGMDDPFYVKRYAPTVWAPPGVSHKDGVRTDRELVAGGETPFGHADVFVFEQSKHPEVAILLRRDGGILLTCDSVQNWADYEGCNKRGKLMALAMGFRGSPIIGPGWRRFCEPKGGAGFKPDFDRLLALDFAHLVPAHGRPLTGTAKQGLAAHVAKTFRA